MVSVMRGRGKVDTSLTRGPFTVERRNDDAWNTCFSSGDAGTRSEATLTKFDAMLDGWTEHCIHGWLQTVLVNFWIHL
jgi:hypothetical protein